MTPEKSIPPLPAHIVKPRGALTIWVIYAHPLDYPDGCVLRPHFVTSKSRTNTFFGTVKEQYGNSVTIIARVAWYAPTIEALRSMLPPGCVWMKQPNEDPAIAEVWMQ